jgi:D-beta-D-heptose 7-phosphate kinase / D-beta-D-heptose 1-phosphate adenosyltransferase
MSGPLLVVGDAMLDRDVLGRTERLCPEGPVPVLDEDSSRTSPGGAALAAGLLARDGHDVVLLTAIACDEAGCELADLLADAGVTVVNVGLDGRTPEKIRLRAGAHMLCRLDRGGGRPQPRAGCARRLVREAAAVLVADYGGGLTSLPDVREPLAAAALVVWDPHPRGATPVPGASLVTPNEGEARRVVHEASPEALADALRRHWRAHAVCVTRGERGAILAVEATTALTVPVVPVAGDPCGAGDRFASSAAALLADGIPLPAAVQAATAEASAFVADGGWHGGRHRAESGEDPVALVAQVRARGGTVVATGGCFDLLHAGHVAMLEAARRLGDCLVVCLNSDSSVRRLKGSDRPLVGEDDRAAVLRSLACVDAVALFDEDTPVELLRRLRPDVFVKGADYDAARLPEADVMAELGGRVATVPYVPGHSTSSLIEKAVTHVA